MHQRFKNAQGKRATSDSDLYASDSQNESSSEVETEAVITAAKPKEPITLKKVAIRSATATVMMLSFYVILQAGHFYCILFVALIQTELYRELVNVRYVAAKEKKMPLFRTIQWAWFYVAMILVCKLQIIILSTTEAVHMIF